ncbi:MAG TPA: hypothetical protein VKE51_05620 [Vicinamibacterales bacterium]|nr:hypothetical protein [Vicinamibacterales bacterium]
MRRALVHLALAAIAATVAGCSHQSAPPFAPWELRGTVIDVSGEHLRVRHKSGQTVDLVLDDRTAVIGREGAATLSALTHGRRVIVNVEPQPDGHARAARVRVFGEPTRAVN